MEVKSRRYRRLYQTDIAVLRVEANIDEGDIKDLGSY